ncbi:MAG: tetratricopeptide repeat protein [Bacteroides sp.]|nr:tetratricopeptide repeat protein [Bacteroides sp.]
MKNNLLLCILFCLLNISWANAHDKQQEAEMLIKKSAGAMYNNPKQAMYYASKVIGLFPEDQRNDQKAEAILYHSQAEQLLGNFDQSIKTLYDALECVTPENKGLSAQIYALMGILYCRLTDYNKAIELNEKATSIFKSLGDSTSLALCYNDRGIIHAYLNEFGTAEQFLRQALAINRSQKNLKSVAANLNNLCLFEGNFEEKLGFINEAIVINKNLNSQWSLGENYNNMGKQYFYAKQYNNALQALQKAYEVANSIGAKELICDNYEYSSWVYEALGDHKNAYKCLMQLYILSKDLQSGSKLRTVEQEISHKRYMDQQRKAELKEQAYEIELLKRNLFAVLIVFISLVVFSIFLYKWYKRKKNMQLMVARYNLEQSEHELAELKVRQQELELKSVQNALENSRQEASSFAVFLHSRNEILEKIREMIKQGYKMDQQALLPHLKKVNAFISQYQSGDKANSTLLMNVEEKNQEFLQRLSECHPNLTQGEKYLATLLRVNLSTKEISMLTGNVPKTINMNRYRLRKSLNLSSEEDLTDYLQNI